MKKIVVYPVMAYDSIDSGVLVGVYGSPKEAESVRRQHENDPEVSYAIVEEHTVVFFDDEETTDDDREEKGQKTV